MFLKLHAYQLRNARLISIQPKIKLESMPVAVYVHETVHDHTTKNIEANNCILIIMIWL